MTHVWTIFPLEARYPPGKYHIRFLANGEEVADKQFELTGD